jgi:hypothetical protein
MPDATTMTTTRTTFAAARPTGPERPGAAALPRPRGRVTQLLFDALRAQPGTLPAALGEVGLTDDPLSGEDVPLALYALYELHYRGFASVDPEWEWDPDLLRLRRRIERAFLHRLWIEIAAAYPAEQITPDGVADELRRLATVEGPSLSAFIAEHGTLEHVRDFAVHRSIYQLKEADPHTWAIPRLSGGAKAALIEIQSDEYGRGRRDAMHCELFADTMRAIGLDARYGEFLDVVPGTTLSTVNLVSFFGLHRRWRGALIGHLALFEMCSVVPMTRYAEAMRRLGVPDAAPFYDVHVLADEWHQRLALEQMVGALVAEEPELANDVVFGARALDHVERRFARRLLDAWSDGTTLLDQDCA